MTGKMPLWPSRVVQWSRILLPMQETQEMQHQSLGWEDSLAYEMATCSSIFAWKIPWTEEPGGLPSPGSQRVSHDSTRTHMPLWEEDTPEVSSCMYRGKARCIHSKKAADSKPRREASPEMDLAGFLISNFQPLELWDSKSVLSRPVYSILFWQPRLTR